MKKQILTSAILLIIAGTVQADYTVKIPLELSAGGALENGSIVIGDKTIPTNPNPSQPGEGESGEEPDDNDGQEPDDNFNLSDYNMSGTFDWSQGYAPYSIDVQAEAVNINSKNGQAVRILVRSWGSTSFWMKYNDHLKDAKYAVYSAPGNVDKVCNITGGSRVDDPAVVPEPYYFFHCQMDDYNDQPAAIGQNFTVSFH